MKARVRGGLLDLPVKSTRDHPWNYDAYLRARTSKGHYYAVFRDWIGPFGLIGSNLLGHLLNVARARADRGDGWFQATARFVERGLGISEDRQERILARLQQLGILEVRERGTPPTRHLRINTARLEDVAARGEAP